VEAAGYVFRGKQAGGSETKENHELGAN